MKKLLLCLIALLTFLGVASSCAEETPCLHDNPDKITIYEAKEPTCRENGLTEGKKCNLCGVTIVSQKTIPAKGCTNLESTPEKAPTCQTVGLTAGTQCKDCFEVVIPQIVIPSLDCSDLKALPAKAPTCTENGLTEGKQCNICGNIVTAQAELAIIDCIESEWIIDLEATDTTNGSKHTECTMCHKKINEETIPAIKSEPDTNEPNINEPNTSEPDVNLPDDVDGQP